MKVLFLQSLIVTAIIIVCINLLRLSFNTHLSRRKTNNMPPFLQPTFVKITQTSSIHKTDDTRLQYSSESQDPTIFTSTKFPSMPNQQPSIGNGYLATVVYSDTIFVNGLYNGKATSSHRARIPSSAGLTISLSPSAAASSLYILDVGKGLFVHQITADTFKLSHYSYAHQVLNRLLVNEITITREGNATDEILVNLSTNVGPKSADINFNESSLNKGVRSMYGKVNVPEHNNSEIIMTYVYWTDIPSFITLPRNVSTRQYTFITSISRTKDDAELFYQEGVQMDVADELLKSHVVAWQHKWSIGNIEIDNLHLSRVVYGSMYYILNSLPPLNATGRLAFPFYGLAPGGLAHGGGDRNYMGHVFWDQETWMLPPILLLHPSLAKSMLSSRTRQISSARDVAKANGYNGTMYPWEMAYSGYDVCPNRTVGRFEQHINGDIAYALQQYIHMTEDVAFLVNEHGFELAKGLAEFWFSRVEYNKNKDRYEVNGVMPPDEYCSNVKNSAYTNLVAKRSLQLPKYLAQLLNASVPDIWSIVADKIFIPYDETLKYHPEFEGYVLGTFIKQADVILLGFPLMYDMPVQVQTNDLLLYDTYKGKPVTNPLGPAMTWAMYTVNWLSLKNFTKAMEVFNKSFANVQQPFMTWTEYPDGTGAINFQTGMGGFLQTILFGFAGIRIRDCLDIDFVLPPNSSTFNITGLNYLGSSLTFAATNATVSVTLFEKDANAPLLQLRVPSIVYDLVIRKTVVINRVAASICKSDDFRNLQGSIPVANAI